MKYAVILGVSLAFAVMAMPQVDAYEVVAGETVGVPVGGEVQGSTTFGITVVQQGNPADPPATISFGQAGNTFRDSEASIRVSVNTNVAANRVIIHTSNLSPGANPQACINTALGIDGAMLVGVGPSPNCQRIVPGVWAVRDNNDPYDFTPNPLPQLGASNAVFVTDLAHVRTFTTLSGVLDNVPTQFCNPLASHPVPPTNAPDDEKYPQYFGSAGSVSLDVCDTAGQPLPGSPPGANVGEELSKNIAVTAFGFLGEVGVAPNTSTPCPGPGNPNCSDTIDVTSPIYLPVGADFRQAPALNYGTNTLTLELVTQ